MLWTGSFCVLLLAMLPAILQAAPADNEEPRPGCIQGTLTTTQENTATGLAGLTLRLSQAASSLSPMTADTDDAGHFEFKNLRPGSYTISLNQPGFKAFTRTVNIAPGQTYELDIKLELEIVAERVEVNEDTRPLPRTLLPRRPDADTAAALALPTAQERFEKCFR